MKSSPSRSLRRQMGKAFGWDACEVDGHDHLKRAHARRSPRAAKHTDTPPRHHLPTR